MTTDTNLFMTHWFGCWRDLRHHECAVAMVHKAAGLLAARLASSQRVEEWMRMYGATVASGDRHEATGGDE